MKKILSLFALGVILLQSCQEAEMDPAKVEAMVNEQAAPKIQEAEAAATKACEDRMATELQIKTDELVQEAKTAAASGK